MDTLVFEPKNSTNIKRLEYNQKNKELSVWFIPKERKNSFKDKKALDKAVKYLGNTSDLAKSFKEKYKVDYFKELDRLTNAVNKHFVYSNVEESTYNEIIEAESVGSTFRKLIINNVELYSVKEVVE